MTDNIAMALQLASLSAAFILAGFSAAVSWAIIPATYSTSSANALTVFRTSLSKGATFIIPVAILNLVVTGVAAYCNARQRTSLLIIVALLFAPIIFTRAVMFDGLQTLLDLEQSTTEKQSASAGQTFALLEAFAAQNYVRVGMFLAAGIFGLFLLFDNIRG